MAQWLTLKDDKSVSSPGDTDALTPDTPVSTLKFLLSLTSSTELKLKFLTPCLTKFEISPFSLAHPF